MIKKFSAKTRVLTGVFLTASLSFGVTGIAVADSNSDDLSDFGLVELESALSPAADVEELINFVEDKDVVAKVDYGEDAELLWADGNGRSISATTNGLCLTLLDGDIVDVMPEGDRAIWYMEGTIPLIELDAQVLFSDGDERLMFNNDTGMLTAVVMNSSDGLNVSKGFSVPTKRCANKYVGFGFGLLWEGLVCVPASLGSAGALAYPCTVAGGALVLAMSC